MTISIHLLFSNHLITVLHTRCVYSDDIVCHRIMMICTLPKLPKFPRIFQIQYLGNEAILKKSFKMYSVLHKKKKHTKFHGNRYNSFRVFEIRLLQTTSPRKICSWGPCITIGTRHPMPLCRNTPCAVSSAWL